jgi:erythronate-4-phosphate dehydrogenase
LDGIIRECDVITFHVPLQYAGEDVTFHLAGEEFFSKVNKGTFILNSSRGEVIDSSALKQAFKSGRVSAAILDVWENEPCIDQELLGMVDYATPHIAGYSSDGKANGTAMCVQALSRFFDLGIDEWYPDFLPEPDNSFISIECSGKTDDQILHEAILHTYKIADDDKKLRESVSAFEKLRGDYPVRREFGAYSVQLSEKRPVLEKKLKRLCFNI